MLASSANGFSPFNAFSRHSMCSGRRLCLPISFPRFSSPFSRLPINIGTLEYSAAASPDGDLIESPITDATAVDASILRTLSSRQKEQISVFVSALLEWNERMNLTSERQKSEVMKRHVEDSLTLLPPLRRSYLSMCSPSASPSCDGISVVDVGSGSGLPGLILAIACPAWNVTLLESMQKRCLFLEHVARLTDLTNVKVLRERAENVGQCLDFRELFDVAIARAVAEMRILAEYCLPLVRVGGLFIAAKGHNPQDEIRNSERAIRLLGGSMVEFCTVESHSPLGQRTAVICFKERATPKKYPRHTGKKKTYRRDNFINGGSTTTEARLLPPWRSGSMSNVKPSAMASIHPSHHLRGELYQGTGSELLHARDDDRPPLCHGPLFLLGLRG